MLNWKHSFERLSKHKYVAHIIHSKKVICICGKIIKLNRKWEEDYLNRHVQRSGCKADEGQRTLYNWFKPKEVVVEEEEEYDSDVYDNMDEDDLIQIDERNEDQNQEFSSIEILNVNAKNPKKRYYCIGLRSAEISKYIQQTPAQFGGSRRIEIVARELFPNLFSKNFSRRKLDSKQKRQLNRSLFTESVWKIDRASNAVRAKSCTGISGNGNVCFECSSIRHNQILYNKISHPLPLATNVKFTPKHYWEDNPLKCYLQNLDLRDMWNILNNESDVQSENPWVALADKALKGAFKDTPVFTGLCEVMGNAIERKLKNKSKTNLKYSDEFTSFLVILEGFSSRALDLFRQNLEGRTIQSIRQLRRNSEVCLTNPDLCYENVARFKRLVDSIQYNGPIVAMTDNTKLKPHIPNIISKIKNEKAIAKDVHIYMLQIPLPKFPPIIIALIPNKGNENSKTISQLHKKLIQEITPQLGIHILSIGSDGAITEFQAQQSIIDIQTPQRLSICEPSLNIHFSCPIFDNIGPIVRVQDPKHAKKTARNTIVSDKQDDAAAYRTFCFANLKQCLTHEFQVKEGMEGFAIYLFIMGEIVDCYLNCNISPIERIRMAITGYFFLYLWHFHIETLSQKYPNFISIKQNFLANQSFAIFTSLCELMMLPKISQYTKALRNKKLSFDKERSPNDKLISETIHHSHRLARDLAEYAEEYDLTSAISEASSEMKRIIEINDNGEQEPSDDFIEICSQLDEIAQPSDNLYTLNGDDSVNLSCQYLSYDKLDFEFLYNQRKIHEAYYSKPLERKFKIVGINSRITEGSSAIQSNMASHFVAYFAKNENPEQRFVTQREKR
ncbi:hypothetical protein C1646_763854 [Rhizophagus diaphanus]|nr:hypothetical protein C1646_763854 [Rhizophagus diaphanus] [Rhizophagus sp. MUCL 43196]